MSNLTFETTVSGDTANVATYDGGVYITSFTVDTEEAAALAASIQSALEDTEYPTVEDLEAAVADAQPFEVGQRVYYDGSDGCVFAPAGEGTVRSVGPDWSSVEFKHDETGVTYAQLVDNSALTPVNAEDETNPREVMLKALRDSMNGQKVTIKDEPKAITADGEEDEVFYEAGTVATIMSWEDYNERGWVAGFYDEDANFPVRDDDGFIQVVGLNWCEPTSREAVKAAAKRVGAEFADRLGIRPGVEVWLPPTSLAALIFGQGTVVSVTDGEATVSIADNEETFLVTSLLPD